MFLNRAHNGVFGSREVPDLSSHFHPITKGYFVGTFLIRQLIYKGKQMLCSFEKELFVTVRHTTGLEFCSPVLLFITINDNQLFVTKSRRRTIHFDTFFILFTARRETAAASFARQNSNVKELPKRAQCGK